MNCPSCSHTNPEVARFCNGCGATLVAHPTDAAVARKVVPTVFAAEDLEAARVRFEKLRPDLRDGAQDRPSG